MSDAVIRKARARDLPALIAALGQRPFFTDRLDRQRRGLGELFVAWLDGVPVGDVYLWRAQPYERPVRQYLGWVPTITHLEVLPAFQNRGIGTDLLRAAEKYATKLGYWRVCLGVAVDNPAARRLYERLGYAEWDHGLIELEWDEPGPDGTLVDHSITCHWLLRALPGEAPGPDKWDSWDPARAAAILTDSTVEWYVAGGWAVDLHLGRQTRHHNDLEVAINRSDFPLWRKYLSDYHLYDAGGGRLRRLRPDDDPDPNHSEVWVCDPRGRVWRMDTFLEERTADEWWCHGLPSVRMPREEAVTVNAAGIAYLRPEYVLLGKAKHRRPKDEADLALVVPTLDDGARRRLGDGLRAADVDHPWLPLVR